MPVKLHLGCGDKFIPGFIHIDQNRFDHVDHLANISDLSMYTKHSVDLIYACHLLEYFHRDEVKHVLDEWYRVLKKGGLLRVAVPDFESIIKVYSKYRDLDHRGILGPLYGKWTRKNHQDVVYHRTVYDFNSLYQILEKANLQKFLKRQKEILEKAKNYTLLHTPTRSHRCVLPGSGRHILPSPP